ncbi:glutamyl-tRNA reductase [Candidatus Hecatella orcuttiae]|uniref:glutamyl-tRNA reductase n=1 Tax=Candidatus Hecatella orcuttiae TaxID=1935119 RepID=UPI002868113F|nr:glutamyl-tRNA reductase [Candidatus Hecatella orcuttiae]
MSGLRIFNLRATYKKVSIPLLEKLTFKSPPKALRSLQNAENIRECLILQTCNRVEIFAVTLTQEDEERVAEWWRKETGFNSEKFYSLIEVSRDVEAVGHLFRLASGLESMVVGEAQILGQIRKAFEEAKACGTVGPLLEKVFTKAIKTGGRVRLETDIGKGAASVGSVAVDLAEEVLGGLEGRRILILGAGETGTLVGKALAARRQAAVFVANRTYPRALRLARMLGGRAVSFSQLGKFLAEADVVVVATSAPHPVLKLSEVGKALEERGGKPMLIIDLSQPRNVDAEVARLRGVQLHNIDDLQKLSQLNLKMRAAEVEKVEKIVEKEVGRLELMLKRETAEPVISAMLQRAEKIRRKEVERFLSMLGRVDGTLRKLIEDMSYELVERIFHHPIQNLRKAAEKDQTSLVLAARKLFNIEAEREPQDFPESLQYGIPMKEAC